MKKLHRLPLAFALMALFASCATPAPPAPPPSSPSALPPPPAGSQRLPGSLTCESEIGCSACADDHDRELVRLAFLVHAAEVRACYDRVAKTHPGTEGRIIFRVGIDPTGAAGTSCIVRSSLNDTELDRCVADVVLTWKFPPRKDATWALVDVPYMLGRATTP
jgi:hypothetical protein